MGDDKRELAIKQMRHAASNIWSDGPDARRTSAYHLLCAMANYFQYGKAYTPQLQGYLKELLGTIAEPNQKEDEKYKKACVKVNAMMEVCHELMAWWEGFDDTDIEDNEIAKALEPTVAKAQGAFARLEDKR